MADMDLYAGIPVDDFAVSLAWYEKLFGTAPSFFPHDTEAVWILAEHRSVYIVRKPERAGHALHTLMVPDLDAWVAGTTARGLEPARRETYEGGARKAIYLDPDGNEFGIGGVPD